MAAGGRDHVDSPQKMPCWSCLDWEVEGYTDGQSLPQQVAAPEFSPGPHGRAGQSKHVAFKERKSCMRALVRLDVPDLEEDIRAPNIREEGAKVREGRSQTWVGDDVEFAHGSCQPCSPGARLAGDSFMLQLPIETATIKNE